MITTRLSFDWRAQVLSHLLQAFGEWHLQPLLFSKGFQALHFSASVTCLTSTYSSMP